MPPSGNFGWRGVVHGAAYIFFAYIGFDAVSTAAQEAKNPQRDMPIGLLGSLGICTILYIVVALVLTGTVHYTRLNVGAPVSLAIRETGVRWGELRCQCRRTGRSQHGDAGDVARPVKGFLFNVA